MESPGSEFTELLAVMRLGLIGGMVVVLLQDMIVEVAILLMVLLFMAWLSLNVGVGFLGLVGFAMDFF